ncbi:hypothetical protein A0J57_17395 [Sphingobium sp. 22B]|uniref:PAS domain-containing protein n=1 Tax=unclassified Sphingobium TaxID=2611147 RepID=UPI000780806E|nr:MULTISPECIES: PAS domain-containing protein [unclassified Sphingobium]KXU31755.1 hypothetical protein AXW74_10890 [Sphingobium sp. AM]KYC31055.1 hypothetical protein A0J57_17395 [Sphingobium sp. 22B]OAP30955.1 hypothetical protein A8O16_15760 [Sphingobium sp. 20006FA]
MDDLPPGQVVTATALIRHFAVHSRQAMGEPIHIMNHGHVGLTLLATDLFQRLASGRKCSSGPDHPETQLDILLDMIPTQVILTDRDLKLSRINLAARRRFGVSEKQVLGVPLAQMLAGSDSHSLLRALERVRDTGIPEAFEQNAAGPPPLVHRVQAAAFPGGFAVLADEIADRVTLRAQDARIAAYEDLIDRLPGLARGTFNVRAIVTDISPALAELVGTEKSRVVGTRFATLFGASNRGTISDAVEELLTVGKPFGMAAALVGGRPDGQTVWVNAAPLLSADGQAGGVFMMGTKPVGISS